VHEVEDAVAEAVAGVEEVPDEVLDEVAAGIRHLQYEATLGFALRVGKLIVAKLYHGRLDEWRARAARDASFGRLAERLAGQVSAPVLYRCMAVYELAKRLGAGVSTWRNLGVSHVRAVLGLPQDEQERILAAAEQEAWTVDRIEEEAAGVRARLDNGVRRGRPPLPQCVKSIHQLRRFATRKELLLEDAAELRTLETAQLEELEQTVAALQGHLADVMKKLRDATEHSKKSRA
jgi:hypothetical protein